MRVRAMSVSPLVVRQGATAVTGFQPTDLSGLVAWYDASKITGLADGAAVATWNDSSGNGNTLTQGIAGSRPIYKVSIINGLPVVRSDGLDDYLSTADDGLLLSQPYTIGGIVRTRNVTSGTHPAFDGATVGARATVWIDGVGSNHFWHAGITVDTGDVTAVNVAYVLNVVFNGASSTFRRNGTEISAANVGANAFNDLRLGANTELSAFGEVDHGELWIYSRALSTAEQQQLEVYSDSKWET